MVAVGRRSRRVGARCSTIPETTAISPAGPVWFLAGSFAAVPVSSGFAATATRRCEVPAGRSLFFPILNAEADNLCPVADPPATVHGLRQQVAALLAPRTTVGAELDGVPIRNVDDYRARHRRSPSPIRHTTSARPHQVRRWRSLMATT
jgi:hypothetical protein